MSSTTIEKLRDLKSRVDTFCQRSRELTALQHELVDRSDFRLSPAEVGLFAETAGGVQLASAVEKQLRGTVAAHLVAAARDLSRERDRARNAHQAVDEELKRHVLDSLPPELAGVEVVSGTIVPNVSAAVAGVVTPARLHIAQTKLGAAELSVRLDLLNVSFPTVIRADATRDAISETLAAAINAHERIAGENSRCEQVLAKLRGKKAA